MWFFAVHLAAGNTADASRARAVGARRTVDAIRDAAVAHDRPFVLGGDFNSLASSEVGDIFRASGLLKYARNHASRLVNDDCKSHNSLAGSAGRQQCGAAGTHAAHIDQIWIARPRVSVGVHRVVADETTSRASDHDPVIAILTYTR